VVTASTAGVGNPIVSTVEDVISATVSVLSIMLLVLPWVVLIIAVLGITTFLWWRMRRIQRREEMRSSR
jgi:Flp pilus assembly protein TadB